LYWFAYAPELRIAKSSIASCRMIMLEAQAFVGLALSHARLLEAA
jgi:hypothetical protein